MNSAAFRYGQGKFHYIYRHNMRIVLTFLISVIIIMMLLWTRPETYAELQDLPPPTVHVEPVTEMDIQPITRVTGKFQPSRFAKIHFQVSGQIDGRFVEAGQRVEQGETLLTIEQGDYLDAVEESTALLKNERNAIERDSRLLELMQREAELQQQEARRLEKLGKDSLASKSVYDEALQELYRLQSEEAKLRHSVDSARSRLMIEQARLNKAERSLQRTKLLAPFSGMINTVMVDVGDYVSPGQAAVELVQIETLDLNLEVTGKTASRLSLGQQVKVETRTGQHDGEIIALSVDPDPLTNTYTLKVRVPSTGLYAGELAVASLPGQRYERAQVVPLSAVLYENGQTFLFEVEADRLNRMPVSLIERYNDKHIIEGVKTGTHIVSRDVSSLADGQTVNVY